MNENYIQLSNGEEIFYRMQGQGHPVVLLHGNMSSSVHMIPLLEVLSDKYRVYAPDMRGFGKSSYNIESKKIISYAQDMKDFLEKLGLLGVHIVGWSFGGGVALELAAISSLDLVRDVFLIAPIGIQGYAFETMNKIIENIESSNDLGLGSYLDKMKLFLASLKDEDKSKEEKREIKTKFIWDRFMFKNRMPDGPTYDMYMKASLMQKNPGDILSAIYSFKMSKEEIRGKLGSGRIFQIQQKVSIIHGTEDHVVPIENSETTVNYLKEKRKLIPVEGGGHFLFFEEFNIVMEQLIAFIEESSI